MRKKHVKVAKSSTSVVNGETPKKSVPSLNGKARKVTHDQDNGAPPQKRQRGTEHVKLEPKYSFEKATSNTRAAGKFAMDWLLHPIQSNTFFSEMFEKAPRLVRHSNQPDRFTTLISVDEIRRLVLSGTLKYGVDLDVTRYTADDGRSTHNGPHGSAVGKEAWQAFETGASLRLLRPQIQSDSIYRLCAHLEAYVETVVGANVYLTPGDSQGFAPHFDDVDAFVCQVSGRKHWRVYESRPDGLDVLPRRSSVDFSAEDMAQTSTAVDEEIVPGDMLYLPRGAIHEARVGDGEPSVHVTVSAFQSWTWADLLEESAAVAVRSAAAQDTRLRHALPPRFGQIAGASSTDAPDEQREAFHDMVTKLLNRVAKLFPSDAAADVLVMRFMRERLPPVREGRGTAPGGLKEESVIRAVGGGMARVVLDDEGETEGLPRLVTCVGNTRDRETVSEGMSCLPEEAMAVDKILKAYPRGVTVGDIALEAVADRIDLARGLVDMGVAEELW